MIDRYKAQGVQIKIEAASGGPPTGAPITTRVTGTNEQSIQDLTTDLMAWLESDDPRLNGVIDIEHDRTLFNTVWNVNIAPEQSQLYGLDQSRGSAITRTCPRWRLRRRTTTPR